MNPFLHRRRGTLTNIVDRSNWMMDNVLREEEPLTKSQLEKATAGQTPGFQELKWKRDWVPAFLSR
jgi:hypothetical protein